MIARWLLAALHLLGLGIGLGSVWARGRALSGSLDTAGVKRVLASDTWWGIAALVWISTGLTRAFGGLEKGAAYYLHNHFFLTKMGLLVVLLVLELRPMLSFIGWRRQLAHGQQPDTRAARALARISFVEAGLVVLMVIAATGMARGLGTP